MKLTKELITAKNPCVASPISVANTTKTIVKIAKNIKASTPNN